MNDRELAAIIYNVDLEHVSIHQELIARGLGGIDTEDARIVRALAARLTAITTERDTLLGKEQFWLDTLTPEQSAKLRLQSINTLAKKLCEGLAAKGAVVAPIKIVGQVLAELALIKPGIKQMNLCTCHCSEPGMWHDQGCSERRIDDRSG